MERLPSQNSLKFPLKYFRHFILVFLALFSSSLFAQTTESQPALASQPGIIITILLLLIPLLGALILFVIKINGIVKRVGSKKDLDEAHRFAEYLKTLNSEQIAQLEKQRDSLNYQVPANELSGHLRPADSRGLLSNINTSANIRFITEKKRSLNRPQIDPSLSKLIIWFLITATFWLVFGTTVGEYLGIKFVAPDVDSFSWLSFGRLGPCIPMRYSGAGVPWPCLVWLIM
jgi:cytochrome c oxidase cbb3-type subunit 1